MKTINVRTVKGTLIFFCLVYLIVISVYAVGEVFVPAAQLAWMKLKFFLENSQGELGRICASLIPKE